QPGPESGPVSQDQSQDRASEPESGPVSQSQSQDRALGPESKMVSQDRSSGLGIRTADQGPSRGPSRGLSRTEKRGTLPACGSAGRCQPGSVGRRPQFSTAFRKR